MDNTRDYEPLRRFVEGGSQQAFAELARRYLGLVYSTCAPTARS